MIFKILILSTFASVVLSFFQWSKEQHEQTKNRHIIFLTSVIICLITLTAGWLQYNEQLEAKNESDNFQKDLTTANNKIIKLQSSLIDSTKKIIDIQSKVIELQDEAINQIRGSAGQLYISSMQGYSFNIIDYDKPTQKKLEQYMIDFDLYNLGNYSLKNVRIGVDDTYKNIKKLDAEGHGLIETPLEDMDLEKLFYDRGNMDRFYYNKELYSILPHSSKKAYTTRAPVGMGTYTYRIDIEWENGAFSEGITFWEVDTLLVLKSITIFTPDKKIINDPFTYFKIPKPKELKLLTVCGTTTYQGDKFTVYWYKKNKLIFVSHDPYDFFGVNNYFNWSCDDPKNAIEEANKMLQYTFNKK